MPSNRTLNLSVMALLLGFLVAPPALSFVIILKDGSRIISRQRPVPQGKNLVFQDKLGTNKMIPADEVDQASTEKANEKDFRDAYVLGDLPEGTQQTIPPEKKPSLSEYIKANKQAGLGVQAPSKTPAPAVEGGVSPGTAPASTKAPKGAKAPMAAPATAFGQGLDPQVHDAFAKALETAGLRGAQLVPAPGGNVRLQAITDTESHVFAALGAAARGLKESRAAGKPVEKVEVYLATATGEGAGHFLMSSTDAEALLNGKVSAARYFVASVIF